ncbi:MAG TPA: histidinol-phosphatase [Deltaproteobacteria bacterium]|nr:histidinol-phosphatase [Deltaproteobacteria bacterium]HCP47021.1 histidinol-phosphatase [Deltaproteobacteria bacterium]
MQSEIALIKPLQVAIGAAQAAAVPILERFRAHDLQVDGKGDGSPVTEADRAAEGVIRAQLKAAFPDIDICGEEEGSEDTGSRYQWVVDPIDGTLSFLHGVPLFGTLIGLEDRQSQAALLGVIHLPALQETYAGGRDLGVRCNGEELSLAKTSADQRAASSEDRFESTLLSVGDPLQFELAGCLEDYRTLTNRPLLRGYTDCFGHAMVLRGAVGAMVDPGLAPWDLAASRALVLAAGGALFSRPSRQEGKTDVILGRTDLVEMVADELNWTNKGTLET